MEDRFEKEASGWDVPRRVNLADRFVKEIFENIEIQSSWKAMEIGAGTGLAGLQILPEVNYMVFEDTSAAMLQTLRHKAGDLSNYEILHGEITAYSNQDIDFAFANMVFHHVVDIDGLLKHLYRIMKAGGTIAIADICSEDGSFHRHEPVPHQGFDVHELSGLFGANGFCVTKVKTFNVIQKEIVEGKISEYEQFFLVAKKIGQDT